jgi:ferric-dicitrate binding protein FerR (iron transport regulator)
MDTNRIPADLRPVAELHDDPALAGLVRAAGRRPEPDAAVEATVRAVVAAEWRQVVAAEAARRAGQRRRRVGGALALAASVAGVALLLWRGPAGTPAPATAVLVAGTVARAAGPVQVATADDRWLPLAPGAELAGDAAVATGPGGRVAIALPGGASLRLDEATRVVFAANGLTLEQGAVYFDTGTDPAAAPDFAITTARGTVRHVGTQFEVRAAPGDGAVAVSIREGRVAIATAADRLEVPAGERLTLASDGTRARSLVGPAAADWAWVQAVAPEFDIEARTLADFLAWVARETGARVEFASPADADAAGTVRLRGSVRGLTPDQALRAVLATTRFDYRLEGARLAVARRP